MEVAAVHRRGLGYAFENHVGQQGQNVGPHASDQGQGVIPVLVHRDAGIQPHAHDVDAQRPIAVDQVHGGLGPLRQGLQVGEAGLVLPAEYLQKVVARAGGHVGDSGVFIPRRAVYRLVEGAVPAAGIDAHRTAALRRRTGNPPGVPRFLGKRDLIGHVQGLDAVHQRPCAPLLARRRVDNENVFHSRHTFSLF